MDDRKLQRIKRIAYRVRKQVELHAIEIGHARNADMITLEGLCAISSFLLCTELITGGIKAEVYEGYYEGCFQHCWVEVGNMIVDITATQFGIKRRISTRKNTSPLYKGSLCTEYTFLDDWPDWQRPTDAKARKIMSLNK